MAPQNPIDGFTVGPDDIAYVGADLQRPECILADPDGSLWVADARGGVVHIAADGSQRIITQTYADHFVEVGDGAARFTEGTLPNGLAFARNGDLIISNFGTDCLEVMSMDGSTRVLVDTLDGAPIGKVNFVLRDSKDRLWLTVSTRIKNWMEAIRPGIYDGFIALYEHGNLRIVADNLQFTNEIRFDADESWLYAVETCAHKITRFRVDEGGDLHQRQTYGPQDTGGFIDGIAFDAFGNLWGTHIMGDRIFAITPEGDMRIILDDDHQGHGPMLMEAFDRGAATPELMLSCGGTIAPWCSSITFGGPDLKTVYVGSLRGTKIPWFRSPVAGLPMIHWAERGGVV